MLVIFWLEGLRRPPPQTLQTLLLSIEGGGRSEPQMGSRFMTMGTRWMTGLRGQMLQGLRQGSPRARLRAGYYRAINTEVLLVTSFRGHRLMTRLVRLLRRGGASQAH